MSDQLATYTFLPWLRQGLSNSIVEDESAPNASLRASVAMTLTLKTEGVSGAIPDANLATSVVRLYGPGDVLAIEQRAVIKTEPRHWITNYEPNDLAYIEFYDEDFPWRYTPAHANTATHRHRPWIMLAVLAEDEFTEGKPGSTPTPFVDVADLTVLPVKEELWAWAHVHANRNLGADETVIVSGDGPAIAGRLAGVLNENPDLAYSRILCARKLVPNTAYHAFLVPTFETGRVAGMGLDVTKVDDTMRGAWEAHPQRANLAGNSLPYYYRWYFRTGIEGDFEYLVRLLKPRVMDARVGRRDIDVQKPMPNLTGIAGPDDNGVLRLGGALKVPDLALSQEELDDAARFEHWDAPRPHPFQRELAAFIDLADDYATMSATQAHEGPTVPSEIGALPDGTTDADPLITAPLYGTWHAMVKRVLTNADGTPVPNADNWVNELNLDPRHRTAAGFGTSVVQTGQEEYMNAAWEQIGDVLEANRKMRLAQWARAASLSWYARHVTPLAASAPGRFLALASPVSNRVVVGGLTVRKQVADSRVPLAITGAAMRRALRPGGRLIRAIPQAERAAPIADRLIEGLNAGTLTVAQPPAMPPGAPKVDEVVAALMPKVPAWLANLLGGDSALPLWLLVAGLIVALVLFLLGLGLAVAIVVAAIAIGAFQWLRTTASAIADVESLEPAKEDPAAVERLPTVPAFHLDAVGVTSAVAPTSAGDSGEGARFKQALRVTYQLHVDFTAAEPPLRRLPLAMTAIVDGLVKTIDPARSIPLRFHRVVLIPPRIRDGMTETFVEAMAYPRIDLPMYRPLADLGNELFLPNVGLIPHDSLSLLETNQKFIESYMLGLNHEFARELLWREYPTDQRGSYFRQFWDVTGYQNTEGLTPDQLREKLYDIPKLHLWSRTSALGDHDNRQPPGSPPRDEVVLSIRGELLKRYPTAVIYAHKAAWQTKPDGTIDQSLIRIPEPLSAAEESNPPPDKVKAPLYEAKVDPDITFLGFDLTVREVRGDPATDDPGWFFVIKERPGEPRFGLDISRDGAPINSWSDLSWDDVSTEKSLLRIRPGMNAYQLTVPPPASEGPEEMAQHLEDKQLRWDENTNAGDVAYVLYQLPVLVAVHGAEMLPQP